MQLWHAIVLGLVEGVTEYLPVSSTGHLILTSHALGLADSTDKQAIDAYQIIIQAGAILAVVGLYYPRFVQMLRGLVGRDPAGLRLLLNLLIAFVPSAIVGLLVHRWVQRTLFSTEPVIAALIVGGAYMIAVHYWQRARPSGRSIDELRPRDALLIGALQVLALWPGASRSMMTITGGYFARLSPVAAAEFSFLLGVPTLTAAAALALYGDLTAASPDARPFYQVLGPGPAMAGLVMATIAAAAAVKFLVAILQRHGLAPFGWYRLVVGVVFMALAYAGLVSAGATAPGSP